MYYIYHIPGVKIGCTQNPKNRINQQTKSDYEILEIHTDIDVASEREITLQKQYGYSVDTCTYKQSVQNDAGKQYIAGRVSAIKQWKDNRNRELQKCSKGGKANAELSSKTTIMCDMNGNTIMTFKNRKDAARYVNGFAAPLTNVLNHPTRTYKGYKWISPL
jgi:hypothetical protein